MSMEDPVKVSHRAAKIELGIGSIPNGDRHSELQAAECTSSSSRSPRVRTFAATDWPTYRRRSGESISNASRLASFLLLVLVPPV